MGINQDVEDAVIKPMRAMYPAPLHLRHDAEAERLTLDTYRRGLARFERPVLERAWQRVAERNDYWTWPKLSELARACGECQKKAEATEPPAEPWAEKAASLVYAYRKRFMETSQTATRAKTEGWAEQLRQYVDEAAWVQAQYLCGRKDVGYSSTVLVGRGEPSAEFFERARDQAVRGFIRVSVPPSMAEDWRRECVAERGRGR
jgi:hypothetical protein